MLMKKHWKTKEGVRSLRKQGLSYKEIRSKIPIAKSTVSNWCKDVELTEKQISRLQKLKKKGSYKAGLLGAKVNQAKRAKQIYLIKQAAKSEASVLINEKLWLAGLMLYWAEGHKSKKIGISNSDPNIIKFLLKWLRVYCKVADNKMRPHLNLHSGQNENKIKEYWSDVIKLPKEQFGKSYIKKEGTGHRKNILYNGTMRIDISNSDLLYRVLGWIDGVVDIFDTNKLLISSCAPIAQQVEHLTLNQVVPGSSPGGGTKVANSM
jgi:hypothetical protein